ncbi:hypothetical protein SASPL_136092 [Salvia splendens]|uniref:Uncharacterized protein n=1 Tax=Salvia splendens TaxID=180675 RepID=A0A4D8YRT9_SALSN|nr:hypothetical protein SASPL_148761 [Salvia splendens]KAG6403858.1 hypothetical protein SASPL_136092 [Salvia splendens]
MEDKSSSRRRFSRSGRIQKPVASSSTMEAISHINGGEIAAAVAEDGRVKIVVRKEDLKQVLEAIRENGGGWVPVTNLSLEQRLNLTQGGGVREEEWEGRS